jgi:hypothetical protein
VLDDRKTEIRRPRRDILNQAREHSEHERLRAG